MAWTASVTRYTWCKRACTKILQILLITLQFIYFSTKLDFLTQVQFITANFFKRVIDFSYSTYENISRLFFIQLFLATSAPDEKRWVCNFKIKTENWKSQIWVYEGGATSVIWKLAAFSLSGEPGDP